MLEKILQDIKSDRKKKVIIDTDAFNEVDDQYSIAYSLAATDKIEVLSINAAPFKDNGNSLNFEDGMERSYEEIERVVKLTGHTDVPLYKGSCVPMEANGGVAVYSPAARNIIDTAMASDEIIYVLGLGACTNIASALLLKPEIKDRIAVIWLGSTSFDYNHLGDFNLVQDFRAGQVLFDSGVPLILGIAWDVVSVLYEHIEKFRELHNVNPVSEYLFSIVNELFENHCKRGNHPGAWGRTIWDIAAPALLCIPESFELEVTKAPFLCQNTVTGERLYGFSEHRHNMICMKRLDKDMIYNDAWTKIKSF